jgi:MacB-like periplasmic core domain
VRTPGIALALLLTIALGIGSNVTVHGFVRGLTRPSSPLTSIKRVVSVFGREAHREAGPLSYSEYLSVKGHADAFEWLGAAQISQGAIALAGQSAFVPVAAVTPNLSSFLGLSLSDGVVVSHRMWQNEFGAKADVRGDPIRIDGVDTRVSGVAPDWLEGVYRDRAVDVWMPLQEEAPKDLILVSGRNFWAVGRLRHDVSTSQAQTAVHSSAQPSANSDELRVLPYTGRLKWRRASRGSPRWSVSRPTAATLPE